MSVPGPLLTRRRDNTTGIPGIGCALIDVHGKRHPHFTAHCGRRTRTFNIKTLGRSRALRRALKVRAEYEQKGAPCIN